MVCSKTERMMPHTWRMIISKQVAAPSEVHFIVLTGQQLLYGMRFVVVQLLNCIWLPVTSWTTTHHGSLSFIISWSLLKLMSIESMMPSHHLVLCHLLILLSSIFPVLYCAHLHMKYSLGMSNFLEEISSLFHSIVFLYLFALFT